MCDNTYKGVSLKSVKHKLGTLEYEQVHTHTHRPTSPCCSPLFVDAQVREHPNSNKLLPPSSYSPISSPRCIEPARR